MSTTIITIVNVIIIIVIGLISLLMGQNPDVLYVLAKANEQNQYHKSPIVFDAFKNKNCRLISVQLYM